jgi:hypothetical protein
MPEQRWGLWILLAIGALVVAHGSLVKALVIFIIAVIIFYLISLQLHPRSVCRRCGGTGRHQAAMFWWADRACTRCAGTPRHRRLGVQILHGGPGQRAWGERKRLAASERKDAQR